MSRTFFKSSAFWAVLLLAAVLGLQYVAGYLAIQLARDDKERDLQDHLADLGRLAQQQLGEAGLALADLELDAALQHGGDLSSPDPQVYRAGLLPGLTQPFQQFATQARLARVVVLGEGHRVLFDSAQPGHVLQSYEFGLVDGDNVKLAFTGEANGLPLYRFRNELLQRFYTPLGSSQPGKPAAVLCLMAGKTFLGQIDNFARKLRRLGLVITLLMVAAIVLIYSLTQRQRRAEAHGVQAAAEAERLASLGTLAAGFAHELRNPLGIIRATTEELLTDLRGGHAPLDAAEVCRDVIEEVDRMNRLVSQFLHFSRAGAVQRGEVLPHTPQGHAAVCAIAEGVVAGARAAAEQRQVTLQLDSARCEPEARAAIDPAECKQILLNLVLNAIEASPREMTARLSVKSDARVISVAVSDAGRGVKPEAIGKIFEPFFTTKKAGSGLGLAISRQLAVAAGGRLELDTEHRPGARFVLTLPRSSAADAARAAAAELEADEITTRRQRVAS